MEPGKLFIGGISWETNEDRLRDYFQAFGEVVEAVIMKDRATGRARGFGFVIFADPAVAERVVKQKHLLDGRAVEAKKAVPRDDQQIPIKGNASFHGSPGPTRTKKIFVGGLASTVTESEFRRYFEQFGKITDVVVMYDHNTQRPRGFGFITFDSEEAVEKTLVKTFHELHGKMVEVKKAVPKELSPGPNRGHPSGFNYGANRVASFLNSYTPQGYSPSFVGGYGVRVDDRYSPASITRNGFSSFGPSGFGAGINSEPLRMSPNNSDTASLISSLSYERGLNALYGVNVKRAAGSLVDYDRTGSGSGSPFNSTWSLWGNGSLNNPARSTILSSPMSFKGGDIGGASSFNNTEAIWGSSPVTGPTGGAAGSSFNSSAVGYGRQEDIMLGSGPGVFGRNRVGSPATSSYAALKGEYDADLEGFIGDTNDLSWLSASLDLKAPGSFEFGLGNVASDAAQKNTTLCW